jgi:predicted esterase
MSIAAVFIMWTWTASAGGQEHSTPSLRPGQGFRLAFPDLPPCLFAVKFNPDIPTAVLGSMPSNYSADQSFPLFVYLDGGWGGVGDETAFPRTVIGDEDYIVVNFPLFRKAGFDAHSHLDGMVVGADDYPAVGAAYKTILAKLRNTIPNIDPGRSIMAGHSNGAKTIAVLLSALDQPTLDSFRGFLLVDGGFEWGGYCRTHELKDHHIFFLAGGGNDESDAGRRYIVAWTQAMRAFAEKNAMHRWRFQTVPGHEHEFPPDYFPEIQDWSKSVGL